VGTLRFAHFSFGEVIKVLLLDIIATFLFWVAGTAFLLKLVWNAAFPLMLHLKPSLIAKPGQTGRSMEIIIELTMLIVMTLAALMIDSDHLYFRFWFVSICGTVSVGMSYAPAFFYSRWRLRRSVGRGGP
jgi:hypothetical protein